MTKKAKEPKAPTQPTQPTYFQEFCTQYHVSDENNILKVFFNIPGERRRSFDAKIFSEDKDGNIDILVYDLNYNLFIVDNPKATPEKPNINNDRFDYYKVKRFAIPLSLIHI